MKTKTQIVFVQKAQEKLFEAIKLLNEAVGNDEYIKTYLIDKLEILASNDHGFLADDLNCDKVIEDLEKGDVQ